ncbi:thiol-disulfide isomerase [Pseudomonas taiwanensis]|uniref:DUF6436 domain-containing protein n=1 Tax=Pseudomonas taiwanensis TaxID=470150 RepID=UPI0015BB796B|nr:DUF6436 domain-containing protein [Pseudomonas taiwanensis]NWL76316.1 thiol-disulfide isomerase [Pseudomonas taiwanensis]
MRALNPKTLITSLALLACVGAILLALRWYESRYVRPFNSQATVFSGEQLRLPAELAGPGPIRLVHFWDPACPCNAGNQQHLAELIQRFAPQGVTFHAVQKPGSKGQLPPGLEALQPLATMPGSEQLPAVPAVGIWDRDGRLAYFGPYSEGAVCNSANSFIEPILEALIDNRPVSASSTLAAGCFCAWREPT